jgi:chaperonin GroEL
MEGPAAPVSPGDVIAGKYKIERVLGAGGMGVVVQALHLDLEQRVAVKFLLPHAAADAEGYARFMREGRAAARIRSQHVVRVSDVGRLENGLPYIVMEYLDGVDLGALVQRGALPIAQAVDYLLQACDAIGEAHTNGVVHRDLKPSNLFLAQRPDGAGIIKVLDFGISKVSGSGPSDVALTRSTAVMGSPLYMSPEQLKSSRAVDHRTDIWALGAILFELITAVPPFGADSLPLLVAQILSEPPRALGDYRSDVPSDLEAVILRCLTRDPMLRPQSVSELVLALTPFAGARSQAMLESRVQPRPLEHQHAGHVSGPTAVAQAQLRALDRVDGVVQAGSLHKELLRAVNRLGDLVKLTLGPKGQTVMLTGAPTQPVVTAEGFVVIQRVEVHHQLERLSTALLREGACSVRKLAGDGSSTMVVLAQAICAKLVDALAAGGSMGGLKIGIDRGVVAIVDALRKYAQPATEDVLQAIARGSANGDELVGKMLAETYGKVGKYGPIVVEEISSMRPEIDIDEGMRWDRGYLSPDFVTDVASAEVVLQDPLIVICERQIESMRDLQPVCDRAASLGSPLLIIAEDMSSSVLATLSANVRKGLPPIAAVKGPGFGERRRHILEDIAILTGGRVLSPGELSTSGIDDYGKAGRALIDAEETTLIAARGSKSAIKARHQELRQEIEATPSDYDREKLQLRLMSLICGVAQIKVGAATVEERRHRTARVTDALRATQAAIKEGVVTGGGTALLRAGHSMTSVAGSHDEQRGFRIVAEACEIPLRQICSNAGYDPDAVVERLLSNPNPRHGFDVMKGEFGDIVAGNVVDSLAAPRLALEFAAATSCRILAGGAFVST